MALEVFPLAVTRPSPCGRRIGGDAGSDLGVARLEIPFTSFSGSSELSRPPRHHQKSYKEMGTLLFEGATIHFPKEFRDKCRTEGLSPAELTPATKESLAILRSLAAKAKGSN